MTLIHFNDSSYWNHFVIQSTLSVIFDGIFDPLESGSHISLSIVVARRRTAITADPADNPL